MDNKIVIVLDGGLVNDVWANEPAEIHICHRDPPDMATDEELEEHGEKMAGLADLTKKLKLIY